MDMLFQTIGGLGLFLFGMGLMSDGLKRIAGSKLRNILESLTRRPVIAVCIGALATCLVQSSSATTVMTVGFVNAGLLTLKQALCVILGANVGTTMTAWLVSGFGVLKITSYALPAVGVGFLIQIAAKSQKWRSIGQIILGFGLLFVGIGFMKDAFGPLRDSENIQAWLKWLGSYPILAVLAGTIITMLLQSSSASIAMVQLLALNGAFGTEWDVALKVAIPFILGDNIGTTITAQIAAFRTSRNARRVAWGHTIFNVFGVAVAMPFMYLGLFTALVEWIVPGNVTQTMIMMHIAVGHTVFNVANTIVFTPIVGLLEQVVLKILPVRPEEAQRKPVVLESHLLNTPTIALLQAKREIIRMARNAQKAVVEASEGLLNKDRKRLKGVEQIEESIDEFQYEITTYLVDLSQKQLNREVSTELPVLLHTVNDLERIGDHAVNITEVADRKIERKISFGTIAAEEARWIIEEVRAMFDNIIKSLEQNSVSSATLALENEKKINRMQVDFRRSHVQRMTDGDCGPQAGLIFIDLVDNIEKIGDHLTNIAQSVIGGLHWERLNANTLSGEFESMGLD